MDHKLNLKKQLACIYTSDLFSGLRITDAVWVALLAARGFSLWEVWSGRERIPCRQPAV